MFNEMVSLLEEDLKMINGKYVNVIEVLGEDNINMSNEIWSNLESVIMNFDENAEGEKIDKILNDFREYLLKYEEGISGTDLYMENLMETNKKIDDLF